MLLQLMTPPSNLEHSFFNALLKPTDLLLLSLPTLQMALTKNTFVSQGMIRESDANTLNLPIHESWQMINDDEWTDQLLSHQPIMVW